MHTDASGRCVDPMVAFSLAGTFVGSGNRSRLHPSTQSQVPSNILASYSRGDDVQQNGLPTSISCTDLSCCFNKCGGQSILRFAECMDGCYKSELQPPSPTVNPSVTIFFGGSYGEQFVTDEHWLTDAEKANGGRFATVDDPGPNPSIQTPVWIENTIVFPYIGTIGSVTAKQGQANSATGYDNYDITAIGYSAGADSALIFANSYQTNKTGTGRVTGLALLEGTMSGGMSGGLRLENEWRATLDRLLIDDVNIYILNDGGNDVGEWHQVASYTPPFGATGTYCYDSRPDQPHWDGALSGQFGIGTNNSIDYRNFVMSWLNNPTPCN